MAKSRDIEESNRVLTHKPIKRRGTLDTLTEKQDRVKERENIIGPFSLNRTGNQEVEYHEDACNIEKILCTSRNLYWNIEINNKTR